MLARLQVLATVLAAVGVVLVTAVPAQARTGNLGRWEGRGSNGGLIHFVVAYHKGRRVFASPSATCPATQRPGYYLGPDVEDFEQDFEHGNSYAKRERTTRLSARTGRYRMKLFGISGRLDGAKGRITVKGPRGDVGVHDCHFRNVRVRRVGPAYGNGIYRGLGTYLTRIDAKVLSGGGLVSLRPGTQWGGPPEPRTTEQLGPAAGLEACTFVYLPGALAPDGGGQITHSGSYADYTNPVGRLSLSGQFVSSTSLAGFFSGAGTTLGETSCPLRGIWGATRVVAPAGAQLHYKSSRSKTKHKPRHHKACKRTRKVVAIRLSRKRQGRVLRHVRKAVAHGWPAVLRVNRKGATARRRKLLRLYPARPGLDRDEYPPAALRGKGPGLERGTNPTGWRASVKYLSPRQNRAAGRIQQRATARYCDGQRVRFTGF